MSSYALFDLFVLRVLSNSHYLSLTFLHVYSFTLLPLSNISILFSNLYALIWHGLSKNAPRQTKCNAMYCVTLFKFIMQN